MTLFESQCTEFGHEVLIVWLSSVMSHQSVELIFVLVQSTPQRHTHTRFDVYIMSIYHLKLVCLLCAMSHYSKIIQVWIKGDYYITVVDLCCGKKYQSHICIC